MNQHYDEDIFDEFVDHFYVMVSTLEPITSSFNKGENYYSNIDELFKVFHNLKTSSQYFDIKDLMQLSLLVEKNLEKLQIVEDIANVDIASVGEWLSHISSQLSIWSHEFDEVKEELTKIDDRILNFNIENFIAHNELNQGEKNSNILETEEFKHNMKTLLTIQHQIDSSLILMIGKSEEIQLKHEKIEEFKKYIKMVMQINSHYEDFNEITSELALLIDVIESYNLINCRCNLKEILVLSDGLSYGFGYWIKNLLRTRKINHFLNRKIVEDIRSVEMFLVKLGSIEDSASA